MTAATAEAPARVFVSCYFAQGEEGAAACEELDAMGAAAWVSMMSGAIDFRDGDTSPAPPWGTSDRLAYRAAYDGGTLRVHVNWPLGYVGITLELEE